MDWYVQYYIHLFRISFIFLFLLHHLSQSIFTRIDQTLQIHLFITTDAIRITIATSSSDFQNPRGNINNKNIN